MIGRYKKSIIEASYMLHDLMQDPDNLDLLLDLQRFLISKIKQCEKRIVTIKQVLSESEKVRKYSRVEKSESIRLKTLSKKLKKTIDEYKHLIFIWQCFGDGIANIYFSKYDLKHLFYNTKDYSPKESAGFLSGKEGFKLEWSVVKKSIKVGMPCVLCDITNVIRHGDVCAPINGTPFPVEIKSSKANSSRKDRQIQSLKSIGAFFDNDGAKEIRGVKNVIRASFGEEEVNYFDALNEAIKKSQKDKLGIVSPEEGLHYIAISGSDIDCESFMNEIDTCTKVVWHLNPAKTENAWIPYYPFTLSINPEYLYSFIEGSIYLVVVIDLKLFKKYCADSGSHATIFNNDEIFARISKNKHDLSSGFWLVSNQLFTRVAFEFQSLKWFSAHCSSSLDLEVEHKSLDLREVPKEWLVDGDWLDGQ
jgi:hypothetical protein